VLRFLRSLIYALLLIAIAGGFAAYRYITSTGLRAQPDPGVLETRVARRLRALAVPADIRQLDNPVAASPEAVAKGMQHFASYCAVCHGNDGSGKGTAFGRGLYPKAPDMRLADTQQLTDGELFYIIENGVRFTGMPAFGTGEADPTGETLVWQLIRFIRHLPTLTPDELSEMESLNTL
jgi:mono/diheme cytochrome c family protein